MPTHRLDSREIAEIIGNWFQQTHGKRVTLVNPNITIALGEDGKLRGHNQAVDILFEEEPAIEPYAVGESEYNRSQFKLNLKDI